MNKRDIILSSEKYMLECIKNDVAHDRFHAYRVLNIAIDIAQCEKDVNLYILIIACLLHDIGRKAQDDNPAVCHAEAGGEMAYNFLRKKGMEDKEAFLVKSAIEAHRYRSNHLPQSIEAKILFDADTIDAAGAMGIARSLQYEGRHGIPIYNVDLSGNVVTESDKQDSFFREYKYKLEKLYERLYTQRGKEIAYERKRIAQKFYNALSGEANSSHTTLEKVLEKAERGI